MLLPCELQALFERWRTAEDQRQIRADYRAGMHVALLANIHRDTKKRRQPFTPADFFTSLAGLPVAEDQPRTWESMLSQVEQINNLLGGQDLRPTWKREHFASEEEWLAAQVVGEEITP